jgi:hypothetical protein
VSDTPHASPAHGDSAALVIPAFGKSPALSLEMNKTREAEKRLIEAKTVNPITYSDLEHCFNESYRELKKHMSTLGYQIAMAEKALEQAKAEILLDKYPEFMKDKPKAQDNADMRKAFMMRDQSYLDALDRIAQLKAVESFVDGRIKVMENVCRYMRKQMDLVIRSGLSSADLYNTQGRK